MKRLWRTISSGTAILIIVSAAMLSCTSAPTPAPKPTSVPVAQPTQAPAPAAQPAAKATEPAKPAAQSSAPYKLGILAEMTGAMAAYGREWREGFQLAIDEANDKGGVNGHKLETILQDGESEPTKAILGFKKLTENDKVVGVAGPVASSAATVMFDTFDKGLTPSITGASSMLTWRPTKKWLFNVVAGTNYENDKMASYLKKQGFLKVAYEMQDSIYGETEFGEFKRAAAANGITILATEKHGAGDKDMTAQITKLVASKPDALVAAATLADGTILYQNMDQLGVKLPKINNYGIGLLDFLKLGGKSIEGVVHANSKMLVAGEIPAGDPQKEVLAHIVQAYKAKWNRDASQIASTGYDAGLIMINALKTLDASLDPDKEAAKFREQFRDAIEKKTQKLVGVNGTFNYGPDNHNGLSENDYVMIVVKSGKFTFLSP